MTRRLRPSGRGISRWLSVEMIGIMLGVAGLILVIAGHVDQYGTLDLPRLFRDMYGNAGTSLLQIAVTVLIIDRLNRWRDDRMERARLIRETASRDNGTALRAVDELRSQGYLQSGLLAGADLKYANLDGAILDSADLRGAYLSFGKLAGADLRHANLEGTILRAADLTEALLINANLNGAKLLDTTLQSANLHGASIAGANLAGADLTEARGLNDEKLAQTESLHRAIMPTGSRYDGRYNLPADLKAVPANDPKTMAAYYDVSLTAYKRGQAWAEEHLSADR